MQALSNLASSLHMLGHLRAAKQLYEQAHTELSTAPRFFLEHCCLTDVRTVQLDYIASRAVLAARGEIPSWKAYLDGNGQECEWSDAEVAAAKEAAKSIEADIRATIGTPRAALNRGSKSGSSYKSYAITSTPRKELW